jgi:hypothetical protein
MALSTVEPRHSTMYDLVHDCTEYCSDGDGSEADSEIEASLVGQVTRTDAFAIYG